MVVLDLSLSSLPLTYHEKIEQDFDILSHVLETNIHYSEDFNNGLRTISLTSDLPFDDVRLDLRNIYKEHVHNMESDQHFTIQSGVSVNEYFNHSLVHQFQSSNLFGLLGKNNPGEHVQGWKPVCNDKFYTNIRDAKFLNEEGYAGHFFLREGCWSDVLVAAKMCMKKKLPNDDVYSESQLFESLKNLYHQVNSTKDVSKIVFTSDTPIDLLYDALNSGLPFLFGDKSCYSFLGDILYSGLSADLKSITFSDGDWVTGLLLYAFGAKYGDSDSSFNLSLIYEVYPGLHTLFRKMTIENQIQPSDLELLHFIRNHNYSPHEVSKMFEGIDNDNNDKDDNNVNVNIINTIIGSNIDYYDTNGPLLHLLYASRSMGHVGASMKLGIKLQHGHGVTEDCLTALSIFQRGTDEGYMHSAMNIGVPGSQSWNLFNSEFESDFPTQKEAEKVLQNLYDNAETSYSAKTSLALYYLMGTGYIAWDPIYGKQLLTEVIEQFDHINILTLNKDDLDAMGRAFSLLGLIEIQGMFGEPRIKVAEEMFSIGWQIFEDPLAANGLGIIHHMTDDKLCTLDKNKRGNISCKEYYFQQASESLNINGTFNNALIQLFSGSGMDITEAFDIFKTGVTRNHVPSALFAGMLIQRGYIGDVNDFCPIVADTYRTVARYQPYFTMWRRKTVNLLKSIPQTSGEKESRFKKRLVSIWTSRLATVGDTDAKFNLAYWARNDTNFDPFHYRLIGDSLKREIVRNTHVVELLETITTPLALKFFYLAQLHKSELVQLQYRHRHTISKPFEIRNHERELYQGGVPSNKPKMMQPIKKSSSHAMIGGRTYVNNHSNKSSGEECSQSTVSKPETKNLSNDNVKPEDQLHLSLLTTSIHPDFDTEIFEDKSLFQSFEDIWLASSFWLDPTAKKKRVFQLGRREQSDYKWQLEQMERNYWMYCRDSLIGSSKLKATASFNMAMMSAYGKGGPVDLPMALIHLNNMVALDNKYKGVRFLALNTLINPIWLMRALRQSILEFIKVVTSRKLLMKWLYETIWHNSIWLTILYVVIQIQLICTYFNMTGFDYFGTMKS